MTSGKVIDMQKGISIAVVIAIVGMAFKAGEMAKTQEQHDITQKSLVESVQKLTVLTERHEVRLTTLESE